MLHFFYCCLDCKALLYHSCVHCDSVQGGLQKGRKPIFDLLVEQIKKIQVLNVFEHLSSA